MLSRLQLLEVAVKRKGYCKYEVEYLQGELFDNGRVTPDNTRREGIHKLKNRI